MTAPSRRLSEVPSNTRPASRNRVFVSAVWVGLALPEFCAEAGPAKRSAKRTVKRAGFIMESRHTTSVIPAGSRQSNFKSLRTRRFRGFLRESKGEIWRTALKHGFRHDLLVAESAALSIQVKT